MQLHCKEVERTHFQGGRPGLTSQLSSSPCPPRLHYLKVKSSWHSLSTYCDYLFPKAFVVIRATHQIFPALQLPDLWQSWIPSAGWGQQIPSRNNTCYFWAKHLIVYMRRLKNPLFLCTHSKLWLPHWPGSPNDRYSRRTQNIGRGHKLFQALRARRFLLQLFDSVTVT